MNRNPDMIHDQYTFQVTFGHGVLPYPQIPSEKIQERRRMLVTEEFNKEFLTAWEACNNLGRLPADDPTRRELEAEALAELGDSIADSIYVLIGTAFEYGIPLGAIWQAVQKANMSKLWTESQVQTDGMGMNFMECGWKSTKVHVHDFVGPMYVVYDQHGKVMKPPSWKAPDITGIIRHAIQHSQTPPDQQARREEWKKALTEGNS